MPIINQITQMKQQGLTDEEIATRLQEQGFSAKQVNEAIDQSIVKAAVSNQDPQLVPEDPRQMNAGIMYSSANEEEPSQITQTTQKQTIPPIFQKQNLQKPVSSSPQKPAIQQPTKPTIQQSQVPQQTPQQIPSLSGQQYPQPYPQQQYYQNYQQDQYANQQGNYQENYQENYGDANNQNGQYAPDQYMDPQGESQDYSYQQDNEMISDIASQIVDEKMQKFEKQITETIRFKIETEGRVANIDERLKRIESIIDRLQTSILGKIGNYERDISTLKQEMQTTQESFSKVLPVAKEEKPKTTEKTIRKTIRKTKAHPRERKKADPISHYLRR